MEAPSSDAMVARLRAQPRVAALLDVLEGVAAAHLVGGAVRDLLLGREVVDLDVVVEGDAAAVAATAAQRLSGTVRGHERFATATVTAPSLRFDVATARRERYPAPGALPEVQPAGLDEDLRRRDFTVNALAVALDGPRPGELHAVPGGLEDLEARRLRVLHDASFRDDPTRLLRLVRYAARLGFAVEPHTEELAREAVAAGAPATVSPARLGDELRLLLREATAPEGLRLAGALGLDRALHPGLRPDPELAARALELLDGGGRDDLVMLATAVRDVPRAELARWLDALELPAPERDVVLAAALDAPERAAQLAAARRPSEVAAAARGGPAEAVAVAGALGPADAACEWLARLRHVALEIGGADVLAAGVPEGPDVGRALDAALAAKLDGAVAGREAELAAALAAIGSEADGG